MNIYQEFHPEQTFIRLCGACENGTDVMLLEQALSTCLVRGVKRIWLVCDQLTQLNFRAQHCLLLHSERMEAAGLQLFMAGVPVELRDALDLTGVSRLLPLLPADADLPSPFFS